MKSVLVVPYPAKLLRLSRFLFVLGLTLGGMSALTLAASASSTTLIWDPSTDPEVVDYRVYYGNASRLYSVMVPADDEAACIVTGLEEGIPYFFAVTAYDRYGNESDFSNEVSQTIYEDAEDFSTSGWDFCDQAEGGGEIDNVFDEELQRHVIELRGSALNGCYRLRRVDFADWDNTSQGVLAWTMKFGELFRVTALLTTTAGQFSLKYAPSDVDMLNIVAGARIGLGAESRDGHWHHFRRDLQEDLDAAMPGAKLLAVKRLYVRGSGRITDIKLISKTP